MRNTIDGFLTCLQLLANLQFLAGCKDICCYFPNVFIGLLYSCELLSLVLTKLRCIV